MGQAAIRLDERDFEDVPAVVQLRPQASGPKPDLSAILTMISRSASLLSARQDRADLMEKRNNTVEEQLKVANRRAAEVEIKLKAISEELSTERLRSAELHKRSVEVVEKSKTMLNEAAARLRAAEARAERAENGYAMIRDALEQQFGGQV